MRPSLVAQSATDLNEGLTITQDENTGEILVKWWAKDAFYYFLQETSDLANDPWAYFPYATIGDDGVKGIALMPSTDVMFFRIELTDDSQAPMLLGDYDGDSVNSIDELNQGTDPFVSINSDGDSLKDDFEMHLGSDPNATNSILLDHLNAINLNNWKNY